MTALEPLCVPHGNVDTLLASWTLERMYFVSKFQNFLGTMERTKIDFVTVLQSSVWENGLLKMRVMLPKIRGLCCRITAAGS